MRIRSKKFLLAIMSAALLVAYLVIKLYVKDDVEFDLLSAFKKIFSDIGERLNSAETSKSKAGFFLAEVLLILALAFPLPALSLYVLVGLLGIFTKKRIKLLLPLFFSLAAITIVFTGSKYFGQTDFANNEFLNSLKLTFVKYYPNTNYYIFALALVGVNGFALYINFSIKRQKAKEAKEYKQLKKEKAELEKESKKAKKNKKNKD